jgi:Domain of unknown function (DUF4375)
MPGTKWPLALLVLLIVAGCSRSQQEGTLVIGKPLLGESGAVDLFQVSEAVWAREAKHGFRALSNPERVFLCVWNLEAEVNNGGFSQFFDNSAGDYAAETPGALRTIGAAGMADLVERAMAAFGAAGPPADREKRSEAIEALPESEKERWEELDAAFINLPSPEAELRAFVEAHRSEFYAP